MIDSGILLLNKEENVSSQKIDTIVKNILGLNKVGHLGTLDPLAKGLLVLLLNDATKCAKYFDFENKKYVVKIKLGETSPSLDEGTEITERMDTNLKGKEKEIDLILNSFLGINRQITPLYSAAKVNGRKLCDYARSKTDVKLPERSVILYEVKRAGKIEYKNGVSFLDLECLVSKGFYIRELARQIGEKLNVPAMCSSITRTVLGPFSLDNAYTLDEIKNGSYTIINPYQYIKANEIKVSDELIKSVLNGQKLSNLLSDTKDLLKIYDLKNSLLAIYKYDKESDCFRVDLMVKK